MTHWWHVLAFAALFLIIGEIRRRKHEQLKDRAMHEHFKRLQQREKHDPTNVAR